MRFAAAGCSPLARFARCASRTAGLTPEGLKAYAEHFLDSSSLCLEMFSLECFISSLLHLGSAVDYETSQRHRVIDTDTRQELKRPGRGTSQTTESKSADLLQPRLRLAALRLLHLRPKILQFKSRERQVSYFLS